MSLEVKKLSFEAKLALRCDIFELFQQLSLDIWKRKTPAIVLN